MSIEFFFNHPMRFWLDTGVLLSVLIVDIIGLFLAYRRLDEMELLLSNCSLVAPNKRYWGDSPRARMVRLSAVSVAVLLPRWNLKRGVIDLQQVQAFPRHLKRLLQMCTFVAIFFMTYGTAIYLYKHLLL